MLETAGFVAFVANGRAEKAEARGPAVRHAIILTYDRCDCPGTNIATTLEGLRAVCCVLGFSRNQAGENFSFFGMSWIQTS